MRILGKLNFNELVNLEYLGHGAFAYLNGSSHACDYQPDTIIISPKLNRTFNFSAFAYRDGQHIFVGNNIEEFSGALGLSYTAGQSVTENINLHIKNQTPPIIINYQNNQQYFKNAIVYVPKGTKTAYENSDWQYSTIIEENTETFKMTSTGICTYSNPWDLDFSDISIKAYIASSFDAATNTLTFSRIYKVPGGEGLLLIGEKGDYEIPYTTTNMVYSNLLKGVTTATTVSPTNGGYTNFILANGSHGIGFYTLSATGNLAAGKAYLQLPTSDISSLAPCLNLVFDDELTTTAINDKFVKISPNAAVQVYNLNGQRIARPTKGLYIINNKKILVK